MREIKFRGYDYKTSSWLYGNLIEKDDPKEKKPTPWVRLIHNRAMTAELVSFDSVGQFTGFKDKTGKNIFEGDILQGYNRNPKAPKFEVTFERGAFCWGGEPLGWDFETQDIDGNPERSNPEKWATIVGNIYERSVKTISELAQERDDINKLIG